MAVRLVVNVLVFTVGTSSTGTHFNVFTVVFLGDVEYAVNELFFCPNMSENVICSYDSSISVDDADIRVDNQTIHPFLPPPQSTGITDVIRSSLRVGNITIINTTLYFGADPNVSLAQCCYLGVCDMETYHLRLGSGCTCMFIQ